MFIRFFITRSYLAVVVVLVLHPYIIYPAHNVQYTKRQATTDERMLVVASGSLSTKRQPPFGPILSSPLFFYCSPGPSAGSTFETDRDVLLHLYRTTCGESWKYRDGWAENAEDLSSWYGVTTDENGRVVKLELQGKEIERQFRGNNLVGEMSVDLD